MGSRFRWGLPGKKTPGGAGTHTGTRTHRRTSQPSQPTNAPERPRDETRFKVMRVPVPHGGIPVGVLQRYFDRLPGALPTAHPSERAAFGSRQKISRLCGRSCQRWGTRVWSFEAIHHSSHGSRAGTAGCSRGAAHCPPISSVSSSHLVRGRFRPARYENDSLRPSAALCLPHLPRQARENQFARQNQSRALRGDF